MILYLKQLLLAFFNTHQTRQEQKLKANKYKIFIHHRLFVCQLLEKGRFALQICACFVLSC